MHIELDQPLLIQLSGSDAGKILNNLTTNQVLSLGIGDATETFITDVRGWVVAHGIASRIQSDTWWFIGQHPDPNRVANHIDRYILREDAKVSNLSEGCFIGLLIPSMGHSDDRDSFTVQTGYQRVPFRSFDPSAELVVLPNDAVSPTNTVSPKDTVSPKAPEDSAPVSPSNSARWDQERIVRLWPKMGIDIWEKCIPQELDRTAQAISFSKGCYLGQETIARLDALGQIQKKLCLLEIHSSVVPNNSQVLSENKEVGTVTSTFTSNGTTWALAVIRRGHFVTGTQLTVNGFTAMVIEAQRA